MKKGIIVVLCVALICTIGGIVYSIVSGTNGTHTRKSPVPEAVSATQPPQEPVPTPEIENDDTQTQLALLQAEMAEKDTLLAQKDALLSDNDALLSEKAAEIEQLTRQNTAYAEQIEALGKQLDAANAALTALKEERDAQTGESAENASAKEEQTAGRAEGCEGICAAARICPAAKQDPPEQTQSTRQSPIH